MNEQITVGQRIKNLRQQAGMKQVALAAALGTARTHLTNIERGRANPGRELLLAIAQFFDVSIDWLANGKGEPKVMAALTPKEILLLESFRKIPQEESDLHLQFIISRANMINGKTDD